MNLKNENRHYTYLLTLAMLFWGAGWSALKILTQALPMDVIIFWRFLIMTVAFIPVLYYFKIPFIYSKKALLFILGSTVLNIAFMINSFLGIKYGLAGAGSVIITSLSPLMTFLLMLVLFKRKANKLQLIGLLLGIIGAYIILELNNWQLFFSGDNIYFLNCALIWAGVTILSQKSSPHIHPIHYSFAIALIATVVAFVYAKDADLGSVFSQGAEFWSALIFLGVFGQTVATTIFFMASGKLGSQKTSSFMFLVPVFALFSAWLLLGEVMQMHIIVGGIISMIAVYFINKKIA